VGWRVVSSSAHEGKDSSQRFGYWEKKLDAKTFMVIGGAEQQDEGERSNWSRGSGATGAG
jgi:hypothetical protein